MAGDTKLTGSTVSNAPAKKTTSSWVDAAKANVASSAPAVNTGKKGPKTLSGLTQGQSTFEVVPNKVSGARRNRDGTPSTFPVGTKTVVTPGSRNLYNTDSPRAVWSGMDRNAAINLQAAMVGIPGLYPKGREPQAITGIFSKYDFDAFGKVMAYADTAGLLSDNTPSWGKALQIFRKQPQVAMDYFRVTPPKGTANQGPATTPAAVANSELSGIFRAAFNGEPTPAEMEVYSKAINNLELKQGQLSSQQREDLQVALVQKRAQAKISQTKGYGTDALMKALGQGGFGQTIKQIRAQYDSNGIPYTNGKILSQAVQGMRGANEFNNILAGIQDSAATLFPAFSKDILAGKSAKDKLSPYVSLAAQVWQVPEDQIDAKSLYFVAADPAKPMDIPSYTDYLYKDPKYKKTQAYKDTVMNDTQAFIRELGIG